MSEERWYLKPLPHVLRDWKKAVDSKTAAADRSAHLSLQLLTDEPMTSKTWKPSSRAADLDALARALEPRITELQRRRMEGER